MFKASLVSLSLSLYSVQGLSWPSWFTQRNNISLPCTGSPWHWHVYIILYTILYAIYMSSKPAVIGLVAKDWLSPKGAQLTSLSCSLAVLGCAWLCSVSVESAYPEAQLPWCCFVARLITTGFLSGEVLATDPATDIANTQTHKLCPIGWGNRSHVDLETNLNFASYLVYPHHPI